MDSTYLVIRRSWLRPKWSFDLLAFDIIGQHPLLTLQSMFLYSTCTNIEIEISLKWNILQCYVCCRAVWIISAFGCDSIDTCVIISFTIYIQAIETNLNVQNNIIQLLFFAGIAIPCWWEADIWWWLRLLRLAWALALNPGVCTDLTDNCQWVGQIHPGLYNLVRPKMQLKATVC